MKSIQSTKKSDLQNHFTHLGFLILVGLPLIGCGSRLGKIRIEHVEAAISQSEVALDQAYLKNAKKLTPELLTKAEQQIAEAKKAREAKQGLTSIQRAYQALVSAQVAAQEAAAISRENELNTVIDRKSGEIEKLRSEMQQARSELKNARSEAGRANQQKDKLESDLERRIQQQLNQVSHSQAEARQAREKRDRLQARYDQVHAESQQAKREIEDYQDEIRRYERQLAQAQAQIESARKASEEAESRAIAQGQRYSQQIETLGKQKVLQDHDTILDRKIQEARVFAQRLQAWIPQRTGKTTLTRTQITDGQRELDRWDQAWWDGNLNAHLRFYNKEVQVEQLVIRTNGENRNYFSYEQMASVIREMAQNTWTQNASADKPKIEAEGGSLVATYRLNKTSNRRQTQPALYEVWEREIWLHKQEQKWRIYREFWRIYEDVPKY